MIETTNTSSRMPIVGFDFGKNWENYSKSVLTSNEIKAAEDSLSTAFECDHLQKKSFLDVGCGTGIFSIAASRLGAVNVLGLDVNPRCVTVAAHNAERFIMNRCFPRFKHISILDRKAISALGQFDHVYSWGVLHHTGAMFTAISNVLSCVAPDGRVCIAIYNRHFTSPLWKIIKIIYNHSNDSNKKRLIKCFYPILFLAKRLITGENPLRMRRGMDFYHDVIDWIGGYPYEYASRRQIVAFVQSHGFRLIKQTPAHLPTGNNEFLFGRF